MRKRKSMNLLLASVYSLSMIGAGWAAGVLPAEAVSEKAAEEILAAYEAAGIEAGTVQYDNNNIAIGHGSSVTGKDMGATHGSIVLGTNSTLFSSGEGNTTLIGSGSAVKAGAGVTAIGGKISVGDSGTFGTAVGYQSQVESHRGTALGYKSQTSIYDGAVALGALSNAAASYSVALGAESAAVAGDVKNTDKRGVVSVGKSGDGGFTRRIVNVSNGENANDAVNKGQLDEVAKTISEFSDQAVQYTDGSQSEVAFGGKDGTLLTGVKDISFLMKGGTRSLIGSGITPGTIYGEAAGWTAGTSADTGSLALGGGIAGSQTTAASVRGKNSIAIGSGAKVDVSGMGESAFDQADGVAIGIGTAVKGIQGTAVGYKAEVAGNQSAAYGDQSKALADKAAAFGESANVNAENSTAIGWNASVGRNASNSVALGAGSAVFSSDLKGSYGVVSIGKGGSERRIIHMADGIDDHDAATVGQIKKLTGLDVTKGDVLQYDGNSLHAGKDGSGKLDLDAGTGAASLSSSDEKSQVTAENAGASLSYADGTDGSRVTADANGASLSYTGKNADGETVKNGVSVGQDGTVVNGDLHVNGNFSINGSQIATKDDVAGISGDLSGMKNQIGTNADGTYKEIHVTGADGQAVTDLTGAVNANAEKIGDTGKLKDITDKNGGQVTNLTDAVLANRDALQMETAGRQAADDELWKGVNALGDSVDRLGQEVDNVGAVSAALAGLHPIDYDGSSRFQLSTAVGAYDGARALAVGGFYNVSPNVRLSLGVSTALTGSDRKTAGNIGATFLIGPGVSRSMVDRNGSVLAGEVADLKAQNRGQKAQIEKQQKELDDLRRIVEQLMRK